MNNKRNTDKPYQAPFRYDDNGGMIWDVNHMWSLDLRGWGRLTGTGDGMAMDPNDAAKVQDAFGNLVVDLLNKDYEDKNK